MSSTCLLSALLILSHLSTLRVYAQKLYPVYYDPNNEPSRNPKGDGYLPVGPNDWDLVDDYSDLYNWEAHSNVVYGPNNCTSETAFSNWGSSVQTQQSPIIASDNPFWACNDRHTTHNYPGSGCSYKFYSTPYSLRVEFHCSEEDWHMDMSRTTTWWNISYVEIKTPAENVIGNGDGYPGTYKRYPAEMIIAHKGSMFHSDRLSFMSLMLDDTGSGDEDLEPFILGWETFQKNQYSNCNVQFDKSNCKLNSSRRLGENRDSSEFDFDKEMLEKLEQFQKILEEDAEAEGIESMNEEELLLDDLMVEAAEHDKRKLAQDYLFPYRLVHKSGPGYYYAYDGSLTVPPCAEKVWWRILAHPLSISTSQLTRIEDLIAKHLNSDCKLATVGRKRTDGSCHVDVNRPLQYTSEYNHVTDCSKWYEDDTMKRF